MFLRSSEIGRFFWLNSLYFSLLAGNFGGEGFASDCVLRQLVCIVREGTVQQVEILARQQFCDILRFDPYQRNSDCIYARVNTGIFL
jgi:hypothetical protein